jgi:hypothetical protein
MCSHIFDYPTDATDNYNNDRKTLTGVCRFCGHTQKSYGRKWSISIEESFLQQVPYKESQFNYVDKYKEMC